MPNVINGAQRYLPLLDAIYKQDAKTSILEGDETVVQKNGVKELKIAKLSMDGLGDFSRASGYTTGSTTLSWETIAYDKERSQKLTIDRLDNAESLEIAFAKLSSEFMRTKVIPETDAARISSIASKAITASKVEAEAITTGAGLISSLRAVTSDMDNAEVPTDSRILFIRPDLIGAVDDLDTIKSKAVLDRFSSIIEVPATRMYTAVTLASGASSYGYTPTTGAYAVNYLVVEKSAVVSALEQFLKYFTPDQDQNGDSHVFAYRNYNLYSHVYENKTDGIFVSRDTTAIA